MRVGRLEGSIDADVTRDEHLCQLLKLLNQLGKECQLETRWSLQARVQRVPRSSRWLGQHRRPCGLKGARAGRRVIDLKRDANMPSNSASDLDLVDELGVSRIRQLQCRSAGLKDRDVSAIGSKGRSLLQPQYVAVKMKR
jgi:hypothetical protein